MSHLDQHQITQILQTEAARRRFAATLSPAQRNRAAAALIARRRRVRNMANLIGFATLVAVAVAFLSLPALAHALAEHWPTFLEWATRSLMSLAARGA